MKGLLGLMLIEKSESRRCRLPYIPTIPSPSTHRRQVIRTSSPLPSAHFRSSPSVTDNLGGGSCGKKLESSDEHPILGWAGLKGGRMSGVGSSEGWTDARL